MYTDRRDNMAKEWTVARTPEDLQRRYKFKDIEIAQEQIEEFLKTFIIDDHLSSSSTNPVQNRVVTTALANKVTKETGKGLSTNDFTTDEKDILDQITQARIDAWNQNTFSVDLVYPVGMVIMLSRAFDPNEMYPGTTWTQIKDVFPVAAGDTYAIGSTGGSRTHSHTLTGAYACIGVDWYSGDNTNKIIQKKYTSGFTGDLYSRGDIGAYDTGSLAASFASALGGSTDTAYNEPPYKAFYMWERIS